jgi:hypothetical protein
MKYRFNPSIVQLAQESSSSHRPEIRRMRLRIQLHRQNEVRTLAGGGQYTRSVTGLIAGTTIDCIFGDMVFSWQEVYHRHGEIQLTNHLVDN